MITASVTVEAAHAVAEFLERVSPTMCPLPDLPGWRDVMNALYAISNDTDAIVTDDDVARAIQKLPGGCQD